MSTRFVSIMTASCLALAGMLAQPSLGDTASSYHFLAFDHGQVLVDERGNPIRFATRTAARGYEESYRDTGGPEAPHLPFKK